MRAAFDHHEKDGFNALSNSAYGFVVICGNFSEVFGFFLVTPACTVVKTNDAEEMREIREMRSFFVPDHSEKSAVGGIMVPHPKG